jgi:serine/threonine protein kinase
MRDGELRILDFGASTKTGPLQAAPRPSDVSSGSGTPTYASCEQLEGRAADPRDDMYALACISYELLTGVHPFARRPATQARNFGVTAARPAHLTGSQWRTLQTGLSWYRGGRPKSVQAWIQRLTHGIAEHPATTPLRELKAAGAPKAFHHSRAAVALVALLLIVGMSFGEFGETSQQTHDTAAQAASDSTKVPIPEPALPSAEPASVDAPAVDARAADLGGAGLGMPLAKSPTRPSPLMVSVDGYQISSGDRYVEIRVHRNQLRRNSSFEWWTEPASARQGVDFVRQTKAIQTFPAGGLSTRFYVKLLPESGRSQPDFFYIAIAQPGHDRTPGKITRAQVWLPTSRDRLQAQR